MTVWALVPIKARSQCKTRLARVLSPDERLQLVRAVLSHVLRTLQQTPGVDHIAVISAERDGIDHRIELLADDGRGLNTSLEQGINIASSRGARQILILPADLPQLASDDIRALLAGAEHNGIAIAPDDRRQGTNGVCLNSALNLPMCFGADSFQQHLQQAQKIGIVPAIIERAGLAFDLDTSSDLQQLEQQVSEVIAAGGHTGVMQ